MVSFRLQSEEDTVSRESLFQYLCDHVPECKSSVAVHHLNNAGKRCLNLLLIFEDIHAASQLVLRDGTSLPAFAGQFKAKLYRALAWKIHKFNNRHSGHFRPRVPWHNNATFTYQDHKKVAEAKASGLPNSAIMHMLTHNGTRGTCSYQRLQYITDCVKSDAEDFSYIPRPGESDAQALLNMLRKRSRDKKDISFCYLYTEPTVIEDTEVFSTMTFVTGHDEAAATSASVTASAAPVQSSIWSRLCDFFREDRWGSTIGAAEPKTPGLSHVKKGKKQFPAENRYIVVNGKKMLLVAILWCTKEEQALFAKYPELLGHDTKGVVSSMIGHWLYSVGYRENGYTYIAMRGLIVNQTLPMFKFCFEVGLPYFHGDRLLATRGQICDGDGQLCDAVQSCNLPGGPTPNADHLRCGWHIIDRAIIRVFGSANKAWHICLTRAFWMWSQLELVESVVAFHAWLNRDFFQAPCVQQDMSFREQEQFPSFIASLWVTRKHWSKALNMELGVFDARTSTFVESQNAVLTEEVKVSAAMKIMTVVRTESVVHKTKHRRIEHSGFQRMNRPLSEKPEQHDPALATAKKFMCPKPLKKFIRQVEIARSCLRSQRSKYSVCTKAAHECNICSKMMLPSQHHFLASHGGIRLHLRVYMDECIHKKVRFDTLEQSFRQLLHEAPVEKLTRVVTAHPCDGCVLLRCSCGYGMRNFSVCLHCSMVIQKVSCYGCCGGEEENIHIRHSELFAGLEDVSRVRRTATDWIGVRCKHVSIDSIRQHFVCEHAADDDVSDASMDEESHDAACTHNHSTRKRKEADEASAAFAAYKLQTLHSLKNDFYELHRILSEARKQPEFDRRVNILKSNMSTAKSQLPAAVGGGSARATHTSTDASRRRRKSRHVPANASGGAAAAHVVDVPEKNIRFNPMTRENEYHSTSDHDSDGADSSSTDDSDDA